MDKMRPATIKNTSKYGPIDPNFHKNFDNSHFLRLDDALASVRRDPYLLSRGVADAAALMGWRHTTYFDNTPGFRIPVAHNDMQRDRFRVTGGHTINGTKTRWLGKPGSPTPRYYHPSQMAEQITAADGHLIITSGEFDLLTFIAAGAANVVAFTSENSIPPDLPEQLTRWGVKAIDYWPDNDAAGLKSARRLHDLLTAHGFIFNAYSLAGLVDPRGDTNDLWVRLGGDAAIFWEALRSAPLADLPQPTSKPSRSRPRPYAHNDEFPVDFVRDVIRAVENLPKAKQVRDQIIACSPFREDKRPSFSFSVDKLVWFDFGTGEGGGIVALGAALGIELRRYIPVGTPGRASDGDHHAHHTADSQKAVPTTGFTPFSADVRQTARYCTEISLEQRTIALRAPLNTGKTEAVIRKILAERPERVLFLTHLQTLTRNQVKRLNDAGVTVELYSEIPNGYDVRNIDRFVCSLNSVHRLDGAKPYDLIVFDEAEQAIPHIWGGTMTGQKAEAAYTTICNLFAAAKQVIVMDAHLSDTTADWLHEIRGDCTRVQNTYQHQWGQMTHYMSEAALIHAAERCATQDNGPVVISTGSRGAARTYYRHFVEQYGEDAVRVIHGWNSGSKDARHLVENINEVLPTLRVFICSPSVGTGVDIKAQVAGVFGYFTPEPLPATHILQQMARFRNADERGIHITYSDRSNLAITAEELLERERAKSKRTAEIALFAGHGIRSTNETQDRLTQLWAMYTAAQNHQKVDLRGSFCQLAGIEGFQIVPALINDEATQAALKATREQLKIDDDLQTLNTPAVSPDELDFLRGSGDLREAHFFGFQRWQIEHTTGVEINQELLDAYRSPLARAALRRFTDYHLSQQRGADLAAQHDRDEVSALPFYRNHYTANQRLFEHLLQAAFGPAGLTSTEVISASQLYKRVTPLIEAHLIDIQLYLDKRGDLSQNPIAVFRRVMKRFHIRIAGKQARIDGERQMVYWIDPDALRVLYARAAQRIAYLDALSTNADSSLSSIRENRQVEENGPSQTGNLFGDGDNGRVRRPDPTVYGCHPACRG